MGRGLQVIEEAEERADEADQKAAEAQRVATTVWEKWAARHSLTCLSLMPLGAGMQGRQSFVPFLWPHCLCISLSLFLKYIMFFCAACARGCPQIRLHMVEVAARWQGATGYSSPAPYRPLLHAAADHREQAVKG